MIVQSLCSYYQNLCETGNTEIPQPCYSCKKVHYALVLNKAGVLVCPPRDLRDLSGKKPVPLELNVPEEVPRASGIAANFLCDKASYVLGISNPEDKKDTDRFYAFRELQHKIGGSVKDDGMKAVLLFLDTWKPAAVKKWKNWEEIAAGNFVFMLDGAKRYVHESAAVKKAWIAWKQKPESERQGLSLVTGENEVIARLHGKIKGVRGAQTSGAALVSFNKDSYCSYDKDQNYNAPMSETSAFEYTTALNYLLRFESRQKVQIGDATTVFWTERPSPVAGLFALIFDSSGREEDTAGQKQLRDFLEAAEKGRKLPDIDSDMKFYILGLSPNASRLSVRFWYVNTVQQIAVHLNQYLDDLQIIKNYETDPDVPTFWQLLKETAVLGKTENINPVLAGNFACSVLSGQMFPADLLQAVVSRIRADQKVSYLRVSLIKAFLARKSRILHKTQKEAGMALDEKSADTAYLLGRLFAVLEKAQKDASPGIKATIKDRFFSSASAMPARVFPQLIRLNQHHTAKLDAAYRIPSEKKIEEIINRLEEFPSFLKLEDQGRFVLGYYHQMKDLYISKKNKGEIDE